MEIFNHRTKIVYGENAKIWLVDSDIVKRCKAACIATDATVQSLGMLKIITDMLDANNIRWRVFDDIEPNPTTGQVEQGLKHIIDSKPDLLIAIGGGSVIDAAKAVMHACLELKRKLVDSSVVHKPLFVAIPTTSGTGSEVTSYAVITDSVTHSKIPLVDDEMLPDVAILDTVFTKSVPKGITAATGMDVITHAVEALMSKEATFFTDMLATEALKLSMLNLEKTVMNGSDLEGREKMHLASCLAGMAFNTSGLGAVHAIAHSIGAKFGIPHGMANAIYLTDVMRHNLLGENDMTDGALNTPLLIKMAGISRSFGISNDSSARRAVEKLIGEIETLRANIGISSSLSSNEVSFEALTQDLASIVESAVKDPCLATNPVGIGSEDMIRIIIGNFIA